MQRALVAAMGALLRPMLPLRSNDSYARPITNQSSQWLAATAVVDGTPWNS